MTLTRKERWLAIGVAALLGALLVDSFLLTPWLERWDAAEQQRAAQEKRRDEAQWLVGREASIRAEWDKVLERVKPRSDEAVNQFHERLNAVAEEAGMRPRISRIPTAEQDKPLVETAFDFNGTCTYEEMAKLFYRLDRMAEPLQVRRLRIGSEGEKRDSLNLNLRVTSIALGETKNGKKAE